MEERPLTGGNVSTGVVRVGDTVRKAWNSSTPAVHQLLTRLRARGLDVPEPLGCDAEGRQILEYVEGTIALARAPLDLAELHRVGAMVRAIHDASPPATETESERWDVLLPTDDPDLICHHDLAPWNLVIGERWVFIDWDGAGPSTRRWDLACAAQSFAGLMPDTPLHEAALRLRDVVDGYRADRELRAALPAALRERTRAMHRLLAAARVTGREPWAGMARDGHEALWAAAADHVVAHESRWRAALR